MAGFPPPWARRHGTAPGRQRSGLPGRPPTHAEGTQLTFFTVVAEFSAFVRRSSLETDPNPWKQRMSGLVLFAPTHTAMITSEEDGATYVIDSMLARIEDGVLKNIRGIPLDETIPQESPGDPPNHQRYGVRLVANSLALGPLPILEYRVSFDKVVFGGRDRPLAAFNFEAPREDIVVDLSLVHRRTASARA